MIKRNVFIGFITGLSANVAGIILYILLFSDRGLDATIKDALVNDYLGKVIALGAALNFLPFFVFLKKNLIYHARGVLLATVVTAVVIAITKII
ncbi:hypothetical protein FK178_10880 [Antarcticibacterium arcticum]|uniref:Uncharacterized protein n=1 Tax=Antarcticibacterium arcticum TaxID=2585771 RepID=A0A5B8YQG8_9FLAO|nr:hypothetical protein [Antarcticibacterium arcticum]QED38189.1 hypothetical protein FK178_10880 [Antarcticibacterium arcticum]